MWFSLFYRRTLGPMCLNMNQRISLHTKSLLMVGQIIVRIIVNSRIKLRMQQMQNQNHDKEENHALDALIWYLYANIIHYKIRNEFT